MTLDEEIDRGGSVDQRYRHFPDCSCVDAHKGRCRCEDDGTLSHREWDKPFFRDGAG